MAQRHCGGSLGKAAKALGLGRSTLYRKFQEKDSVGQSQKIELLGDAA
jgi:DNA-binding NtrC family response regulator